MLYERFRSDLDDDRLRSFISEQKYNDAFSASHRALN